MKKKWKIVIIVLSVTLIVTAVIVALYPTASKVQTEQKIEHDIHTFDTHTKKDNIIPKNTTVNFRYINFSPLPEDTYSLAEHCINKILKMNS